MGQRRSGLLASWSHDTMTKNLTVRLPDDVAADAEAWPG